MRWAWDKFFKTHDELIASIMAMPEFGDLKTIGLAKLLEGAGFAFTHSPGHY